MPALAASPPILVTGASRGIGRAIAAACAERGGRVIGTSRQAPPPAGDAPRAGQVDLVHLDLSDRKSVDSLFDWLEELALGLGVLVNNAGIGVFGPLETLSPEDWERVLTVNLTGAFLCTQRALPIMKRQGGGRIINVGSVADHTPFESCAAYCASKYGLRGLTEVTTEEGKANRVFATLVSPGAVATEIWSERPEFDLSDMLTPETIARMVAHVAGEPLEVRLDRIDILPPKGTL